jgi:uncharacterized protein (TIGR02598 family)
MKDFRTAPRKSRLGFSLVEASMSIGILSLGFLSLTPLLGLGLTSARQSRDGEVCAQIARNLAVEAREGTLATGSGYCDQEGNACASNAARFATQTTETTLAGNCMRVTIQVAPVNAPNRVSSYAVVLPPSS